MKRNKSRKILLRSLLGLFAASICCLVYGYVQRKDIQLKEYTFVDEQIPQSFVGKKIIFISDIHCNRFFTDKDVKDLVERINERNPDIVVIGGDHTNGDPNYVEPFFKEIALLESKYGVYTVLGNHDHWWNAEQTQKQIEGCGFKICDNRSYWIKEGNDSIKIGGIGDFWEDEQVIDNTISDLKPTDFCILLSHNPDYLELLDSDHVNLMLSGHTHAGQITFFGLWAPITPSTFHPEYLQTGQKYIYGWTDKNKTRLYTTSGIGVGTVPIRLFTKPEIVEITLQNK